MVFWMAESLEEETGRRFRSISPNRPARTAAPKGNRGRTLTGVGTRIGKSLMGHIVGSFP